MYQAQKKKKKKSSDGLLTRKMTCAKLLYFFIDYDSLRDF
jgi:hypothetical protein